jgi:hypothetical protein
MNTKYLLAGLILMISGSASAQNRVYVFEEETIQGTIEKPEAFYILSPSNLDYEALEAEESFLEELYDTVETAPFH